jgi:hypothetical protein
VQLLLTPDPAAPEKQSGTTGLYHLAIRLPIRLELGRLLHHVVQQRTRFQGFADHLVSEALYLADPDGNGRTRIDSPPVTDGMPGELGAGDGVPGMQLIQPVRQTIPAPEPRARVVSLTVPRVIGAVLLDMKQVGLAALEQRGILIRTTRQFVLG